MPSCWARSLLAFGIETSRGLSHDTIVKNEPMFLFKNLIAVMQRQQQPGPQADQVPHPRPPAPVASQSHSVPVNSVGEWSAVSGAPTSTTRLPSPPTPSTLRSGSASTGSSATSRPASAQLPAAKAHDAEDAVAALYTYVKSCGGVISATSGVADFYKWAKHDGDAFKEALRSLGSKKAEVYARHGLELERRDVGSDMIKLIDAVQSCKAGGRTDTDDGFNRKEKKDAKTLEAAPEVDLVARTLRQQKAEDETRAKEAKEQEQAKRSQRAADQRQAQQQQQPIRASQQAAVPKADDVNRRFFDKAVKTETFTFKTVEAERFAEALETYADGDLPWRLTRRDEYGLKRMVDAAQTAGADATMVMVRALMQPKYKEDKFRTALKDCVRELFAAHNLLEGITRAVERKESEQSSKTLSALVDFGLTITNDLGPTQLHKGGGDRALGKLAAALVVKCRDLVARKPKSAGAQKALEGAQRLRKVLDREVSSADHMRKVEAEVAAAADRQHAAHITQWPGGRHSNDHVDFRQISIVPTVDELFSSQDPFLPRVDRVNTFLAEDQQTQLLDRQFRLLREDMIHSVRDALGKGVPFYLQVALVGLEDHGYLRPVRDHRRERDQRPRDGDDSLEMGYQRGPSGLRFKIEDGAKDRLPRGSDLIELLSRRRLLQVGSLALLSDGDQPIAIGRVVKALREASNENPTSDQQIGISFDDENLVQLLQNKKCRLSRREVCSFFLAGKCKYGDQCKFPHESNTFQLVPIPGSFFAYEPVLKCLQKIRELPFCEELLLQKKVPEPPTYHATPELRRPQPQNVMDQLGEWRVDASNLRTVPCFHTH